MYDFFSIEKNLKDEEVICLIVNKCHVVFALISQT